MSIENKIIINKVNDANKMSMETKTKHGSSDSRQRNDIKGIFPTKANGTKMPMASTGIAAIAAASVTSTATTVIPTAKRNIGSMSDDEIIQENLKQLFDKKSQEERKANGRLIAVIVAFLVIFLAMYHAWIRKSTLLAGIIVPAVIMLSYGGWVVILTKRDKRKKAMFEKHLEEVGQRNKIEHEEKFKNKQTKKVEHATLRIENEKLNKNIKSNYSTSTSSLTNSPNATKREHKRHKKHHQHPQRHRTRHLNTNNFSSNDCSDSGIGSGSTCHVNIHKPPKRRSIRQKLFRQYPNNNNVNNVNGNLKQINEIPLQMNRMKEECIVALPSTSTSTSTPPLVRMGSVP